MENKSHGISFCKFAGNPEIYLPKFKKFRNFQKLSRKQKIALISETVRDACKITNFKIFKPKFAVLSETIRDRVKQNKL